MDFYFVLKKNFMTLVMDLHHDTLIQRNINSTRIKMYKIRNPLCTIEANVHKQVRSKGCYLLEIWGPSTRFLSICPNPIICQLFQNTLNVLHQLCHHLLVTSIPPSLVQLKQLASSFTNKTEWIPSSSFFYPCNSSPAGLVASWKTIKVWVLLILPLLRLSFSSWQLPCT